MSFEDWLDEVEIYSSRYERALGDVTSNPGMLYKWLKAAYEVGYEKGKADVYYEMGRPT